MPSLKIKLRPIQSEKDHKAALEAMKRLWDSKPGTEEHVALEVLSILVERYEEETIPLSDPDPIAAIRFRMEQAGMEPGDLIPILGSKSRVSEILKRKRKLSMRMIRNLHDKLNIPFESLIPSQPEGARGT